MWLVNFQTLLLLLQVAVCEADDTSASPAGQVSSPSPALTAPPAMVGQGKEERNIDPKVIGSTSVTAYSPWTTWSCPSGSTWTTLPPFAGCRTTASVQAPMYTGCANGSVLLGPFDNDTCTGTQAQTSCVTGWIYYNDGLTLTNYECWPTWTQGNWCAWREEATGLPLGTVVALAVVLPVVVIGAVVAGLWVWRRRRQRRRAEMLMGLRKSLSPSTPGPSEHAMYMRRESEYVAGLQGTKELEERRRVSELSGQLSPHETILGTMGRFDEECDDASSYHTTETRHVHELQAGQSGEKTLDSDGRELERSALQKLFARFRL